MMNENRSKFETSSQQIVDTERDWTAWTVFEGYDSVRREGTWWVEARGAGMTYCPLVDCPGLFHDFATIGRRFKGPDDTFDAYPAALEWARNHGVLGLSPVAQIKQSNGLVWSNPGNPGDVLAGFVQGDHYRDSVAAFVREAWMAGAALTFYEAALSGDLETVEWLDEFDEFRPSDIPLNAVATVEARTWGLSAAAEITQARVSAWCSPTIYRRKGRLERGWGFMNLAGAMWLQMLWRLTAGDEDPLCRNPGCLKGRPVLYREPGRTGPRKKYCSDYCKKDHHYRETTVPRRRRARGSK
jgi:hypothetical protein